MYYVEYINEGINNQSDPFEDIDDAYIWAFGKGMIDTEEPENENEFKIIESK